MREVWPFDCEAITNSGEQCLFKAKNQLVISRQDVGNHYCCNIHLETMKRSFDQYGIIRVSKVKPLKDSKVERDTRITCSKCGYKSNDVMQFVLVKNPDDEEVFVCGSCHYETLQNE